MNWQLLSYLAASYTLLFCLLGWLATLGLRYLGTRFAAEFGRPFTEENVADLEPEEDARWNSIRYGESGKSPFRWIETLFALLQYPAILVISVLLQRDVIPTLPAFFISGSVYVTIAYRLLRK